MYLLDVKKNLDLLIWLKTKAVKSIQLFRIAPWLIVKQFLAHYKNLRDENDFPEALLFKPCTIHMVVVYSYHVYMPTLKIFTSSLSYK